MEGLSSTSLFLHQVIYSLLCCMLMGRCFSSFSSLSLVCPQQSLHVQKQHRNTEDEISNNTLCLLQTSYLIMFITFTLRTFPFCFSLLCWSLGFLIIESLPDQASWGIHGVLGSYKLNCECVTVECKQVAAMLKTTGTTWIASHQWSVVFTWYAETAVHW